MISSNSSITDIPRDVQRDEADQFGISPFEKGLVRFVEHTSTPITIALQGEWGSGKTSLMNSLKNSLCTAPESAYHSVWLNTWEYALMKDAQSTLFDIIGGLIKEVTQLAKTDESNTKKLLGKLGRIGSTTARFVAKTAANKLHDGAGDLIDDMMSTDPSQGTIGEIRQELEDIIASCLTKDNKKGFIFYIDDLDRIDPPIAVNLLELLKNIFNLNNCIFILAIDYDVVVKGLEPKFGPRTDLNEREFRSFFDKIIQVPFSMPVASYAIDTFLKDSLTQIDYINGQQAANSGLLSYMSQIASLSVGTNPRSLKRLINSLSLINCINITLETTDADEALDTDLETLVNFALVSIQIAYPPVYNLLNEEPDFTSWNDATARKLNLKALSPEIKEKLKDTDEFDDDWEQVLFRLCERDPYLKRKSLNISRILNLLTTVIEEKDEHVEETITSVIKLSSVTNVDATEPKKVIDYHRGSFLKSLRGSVLNYIKKHYPELEGKIHSEGSRVQTNARIKFEIDGRQIVKLHSTTSKGQIRIQIIGYEWVVKDKGMTFEEHATSINELARYQKMKDEYAVLETGTAFEKTNWTTHSGKNKGYKYLTPHLSYFASSPDEVLQETHVKEIAEMLLKLQPILAQMQQFRHIADQNSL